MLRIEPTQTRPGSTQPAKWFHLAPDLLPAWQQKMSVFLHWHPYQSPHAMGPLRPLQVEKC